MRLSSFAPIVGSLGGFAVGGPAGAAVGGALGGAIAGDEKQRRAQAMEDSDRKLAAETQRYSPWTEMKANPIRHAGTADSVFEGAVGGAAGGADMATQFGMMSKPATGPVSVASIPEADIQGMNASKNFTMEGSAWPTIYADRKKQAALGVGSPGTLTSAF